MNTLRSGMVALVLAVGCGQGHALLITGYSPGTYDRFASGYSSAPVPNTSPGFIGAAYNWSGVGWDASLASRNVALIGDRYFVYAAHYTPSPQLRFFSPTLYAANPGNPAGAVVNYHWSVSYSLYSPLTGLLSDFRVGRLDSAVNPAQGLASYPILDLPDYSAYQGLPLLVYGHGGSASASPRIGTGIVDGFAYSSSYNSLLVTYEWTGATGSSYVESGDSGGPLFALYGGALTLLGSHFGHTTSAPFFSADHFIPGYLDQMAAYGIGFTTVVPEPGVPAMMAVVVLLALGVARAVKCGSIRTR